MQNEEEATDEEIKAALKKLDRRSTLLMTLQRATIFLVGACVTGVLMGAGYGGWPLYLGIAVTALAYGHISTRVAASALHDA